MRFVGIGDGIPFIGKLPTAVDLPKSNLEDGEIVTTVVHVEEGDKGWDEALYRWMFLNGYCFPEDNEREIEKG